jgi:hypothetical protein
MVPKKPMPITAPGDPTERLQMSAMAGDAINASGMPLDLNNSIKEKLNANKKSLPGVGFKPPMGSGKANRAAKCVKKANKKMNGKGKK